MGNRKRKKKRKQGFGIIAILVLMICGIVSYNRLKLEKTAKQYEIQLSQLETKMKKEQERVKEIEEYKAYIKTNKYIEDMARLKLGLVYEDEIICEAN